MTKVTDAEITEYMSKNKKKFKQMSLVKFYVLIEDKASAQDEAEVKNKITSLLSEVVYNQATGKMILFLDLKMLKYTIDSVNANLTFLMIQLILLKRFTSR